MHRFSRLMIAVALVAALLPAVPAALADGAYEGSPALIESGSDGQSLPGRPGKGVPTGDVLVRFKPGTGASEKAAAHAAARTHVVREFTIVPGLVQVRPNKAGSPRAALVSYQHRSDVMYAELDEVVQVFATAPPNDPRFGEQWPLSNTGQNGGTPGADIGALTAWDDTIGSRSVVVAVVDGGVNYKHEDLAANMWTNPGEIPGNRIDDDANGIIDDVRGADFASGDGDPIDQSLISHGSHVAGIIGAVGGNATGISGVNQRVSIMPVRVTNPTGGAVYSNIAAGVQYAASKGARVLNMSLAWTSNNLVVRDALAAFPGVVVCAAGNAGGNNDATPWYPASYTQVTTSTYLPNMIAVGASTNTDSRASYSNYGATTVDLFAPGDQVLSTVSRWDTLYYDDMTDLSDWGTSRYVTKPWATTSASYVSSPACAGHMGYANGESSYIIRTAPVDLTACDYAKLVFDAWLHTESYYDWLRVYASEDATITDADLIQRYSGGAATWYMDRTLDLSRFTGKQVWLAFEFRSDATNNAYSGVMVDDVQVLGGGSGSAYSLMSGTSMAAPHVAGVAALLLSEKPTLTTAEVRSLIVNGAKRLPVFSGLCVTGARLDAAQSRALLGDVEPPVTTASAVPSGTSLGPVSVALTATDDRSGVAWTRYSLDGAAEVSGTALTVTGVGPHTVAYHSADVSGNVEPTRTLTVAIAGRYQETDPALGRVGPWSPLARWSFSGGSAIYAAAPGSSVTATFAGTGIDWIGAKSTSAGLARVYVDGVQVATVDLYSNVNQFQRVLYSAQGLPYGTHSLRIETTGMRNRLSWSTNVWVDAFDVVGTLTGP